MTKFLRQCAASRCRHPRINVGAFAALLIIAAAVPFPFGGVLPSGKLRIELFAFLVAGAAFLSDPRGRLPRGVAIPASLVAAIALLGVFQVVPVSPEMLRHVSSTSAEIYHEVGGLLRAFGRPLPAPRISIAPGETAGAVLLVLADVAVFLAAAILLENRPRRRLFALILVLSGAAQIAWAAADAAPGERMHGLFVNPDHFAGYLEIALAVAFAGLWNEVRKSADRARGIADAAERWERRLPPLAFRVLVWGFLATGIALTRSRGGIGAAVIATAAMLSIALTVRRSARASRAAIVLALIAGIVFVGAAARREAVARFISSDPRDIGADMRIAIWRTTLDAAKQFPVFGSGLGTFREAFRRVQPRTMSGLVEQAHNDGLQLLVTAGPVGFAAGALAFFFLFVALARALAMQKHREERAMVLAGIGALFSLVVHGLVDFNMSIPAIPATLAAVLGFALAAGSDGDPRSGDRPGAPAGTTPFRARG